MENGSKFDDFFDCCLNACKEENIDLRPNWSRFYDACKLRKIFWTKEPTTYGQAVANTFVPRPVSEPTEDDFWKIEIGYAQNPQGAQLFNYDNPYAQIMDLGKTAYPELYCYYLALFKDHTTRQIYTEQLAQTFNLSLD